MITETFVVGRIGVEMYDWYRRLVSLMFRTHFLDRVGL